jgi:hypothetical protein
MNAPAEIGRRRFHWLTASGVSPAAADDTDNGLISRVETKRAEVERYLRTMTTRRHRLVTLTIVAAALATLLTAPAALGGKSMSDWLNETFQLTTTFPAWRMLCLLAALCSLTAAIATQLHASKNYEHHIARAQEIKCRLEMLEVAIDLDHFSQHEAASQYLKIIENTDFIEPTRPTWD